MSVQVWLATCFPRHKIQDLTLGLDVDGTIVSLKNEETENQCVYCHRKVSSRELKKKNNSWISGNLREGLQLLWTIAEEIALKIVLRGLEFSFHSQIKYPNMLSSPPIHHNRDCHTLAKTACVRIWGWAGCNSFYYWECHLRQEKTLIIEPMAPVKGIQIELEARVITLWLVNCHPLRLSY